MNRLWTRLHELAHGQTAVLMVHTPTTTELKCQCGAVRVL